MAKKPKRDKRTGRFVPKAQSAVTNDRTPFAPGGQGVPGGWSVNPDTKPSKRKKQKIEIIRHEDRVEPAAKGLKAMFAFAGKMIKAGYPVELSGRAHTAFKDAEKKAKVKKGTKKDNKTENKKGNNSE
jgi:hypothetical protein